MKPPFMLVGAALAFWGWQTGLPLIGLLLAVAYEGARWVTARWEFAHEDFSRIWTFCTLALLGASIYAFTANQGPADVRAFISNPGFFSHRNAGAASARTAAWVIRWMPLIFFLFLAAQQYSGREGIPLETISLILRRRWRKARKLGLPTPPSKTFNIGYPYFILCLVSASCHTQEDATYFWGLIVLLGWAMWAQRSRRFSLALWMAAMGAAIGLAYGSQRGVGQLQRYLEGINAQWLERLTRRGFDPNRSRTSIGQIGRLKSSGKILIRLESKDGPPPTLLRETSYRNYKAQTWYASSPKPDLDGVLPETNKNCWPLIPFKTNIQAATIATYVPAGGSFLPLPTGCGRIEHLPAYVMQKSSGGAVFVEAPGLVIYDAFYGPGPTIDSPANGDDRTPRSWSTNETAALERVCGKLGLQGMSRAQAVRTLSTYFQSNFVYSTWQGRDFTSNTNESPLAHFLLETHAGHCEYFATAAVLLLRQAGIPARYAVGYAVHEPSGNGFLVRARDAHAWCLVWNGERQAWQDFDPTPASWVEAENLRASPFQAVMDIWSRLIFEFSKFRYGQSRLRQYFLFALVPVLVLLLHQILRRSRRKKPRSESVSDYLPECQGLDSEFYEVEKTLAARGVARHKGEPLSVWLERSAEDPAVGAVKDSLSSLLRLHYRYRFDPDGLTVQDRETLRRNARQCAQRVTSEPEPRPGKFGRRR